MYFHLIINLVSDFTTGDDTCCQFQLLYYSLRRIYWDQFGDYTDMAAMMRTIGFMRYWIKSDTNGAGELLELYFLCRSE